MSERTAAAYVATVGPPEVPTVAAIREMLELMRIETERLMAFAITDSAVQAKLNFEKIIQALGADVSFDPLQMRILLKTGEERFVIVPGAVTNVRTDVTTCFFVAHCIAPCETYRGLVISDMPVLEQLGTAALLLHHNPALFKCWCREDGAYS